MVTKEKDAKSGGGHTESGGEVKTEEKPLRVALYLRVSTDDQTIDMQRDYLIKYAKERGWRIFTVFSDEAKSGRTKERRGFQDLLKSIEYKGFDAILVYKTDRLFRNLRDALDILSLFEKEGIKVISATDQVSIDRMTPENELASNVMLSVGDFWAKTTMQKIKDGRNYALKKGYYCARPPFGYKVVDHKLVVDEDKRYIVQEIFRDRGNGFSWGDLSKKYNIRKSTLQGIIANPIYRTGEIKSDGQVVAKVEPIVSISGITKTPISPEVH